MDIDREELLMKLGAARSEARAAWRLIDIEVAPNAATFSFALNRQRLRSVRQREGRYLLHSNLCGQDPAQLWQFYIQLVEIEATFKTIKDDLNLRPIYHQCEQRIEAHIFVAFLAYCLHVSKWPARQMYEAFLRHVPKEQVFMDINSIAPGADFAEILQNQVSQCEIVLALIGPGWAGNTDPSTGQRRLDNPKDFVRIEICAALSRAIRIVPVLLDDAPMPNGEQLPEDMRKLVGRQAELLGYRTFDADVDRLIRRIGFGNARMQ